MKSPLFNQHTIDVMRVKAPLFMQAHVLKVLDHLHAPEIERIHAKRLHLLATIARVIACAEGGKIAVIESGRDCDGVEYSGRVHTIDASMAALRALDDDISDWADGPYHLSVCSPSEAAAVEYESRDLVMEAHENGHRHVIYSQFP